MQIPVAATGRLKYASSVRPKLDIYDGKDPREIPRYTIGDAATYLAVPASTLRSWVRGQSYAVRGGRKRFVPLIRASNSGLLTFNNFVEAFVLASLTRTFQVPLPRVRAAMKKVGGPRPLLTTVFQTDGVGIFVEHLSVAAATASSSERRALVDVSRGGQLAMPDMFTSSLRRIDGTAAAGPQRVFPWLQSPTEDKVVAIDPRRAFGRPTVADRGVAVDVVADRYAAGDSRRQLARDYDLTEMQLDDVLRWVVRASHVAQAA